MIHNKNKEISSWIKNIKKEIENKTIFEVTKNKIENLKNKGNIGNHMQLFYFHIPINSKSEPDFMQEGIELKVTPMIRNKNDYFRSKERLVFGKISYSKIINDQNFYTSHFMQKNQKTLIIFYEYDQNKEINDWRIIKVNLFDLLKLDEIKQIEYEYKIIVDKVSNGEAHLITSSDTEILEACTKGSKTHSISKQPNSNEIAKSRAFAFKSSFITKLYYRSTNIEFNESYMTIDDVIKKINEYKFFTINNIEKKLGIKSKSKSNRFHLIKSILNVAKIDFIKPLIDNNIIIKTINLEEDFSLIEHIPLCRVEINEMDKDTLFEDTNFYDIVVNRKILFVLFQKKGNDSILLDTIEFKFPIEAVESSRETFEHTKSLFNNGGAICENINKRNDYFFIKSSDNVFFHVRPGAANSKDNYRTPANESITKQKYWLNKTVIVNQYKKHIL